MFFSGSISGVPAAEAVMVGDDVRDDIGGALSAGLRAALLVRTGKYLAGDETKHEVGPSETGKGRCG